MPNIKTGVKLPKSNDQWKLANAYFAPSMPISDIDKTNVELITETMNSNTYIYLFPGKLWTVSKSGLISSLKTLKMPNVPLEEIKYVANIYILN